MDGTNWERLKRLLRYHVQQPRFILPWFAKSLIGRRQPVELGLPWFSFASIEYLKRRNLRHSVVFEFGSGGTTLFFARRCREVIAVESDAVWADRVSRAIDAEGLRNVTVRLEGSDFASIERHRQSSLLQTFCEYEPDIVVIDHFEGDVQTRVETFLFVQSRVKSGAMVIVDDAWRYSQIDRLTRAQYVKRFESVGPARYGVTSTDIHFY